MTTTEINCEDYLNFVHWCVSDYIKKAPINLIPREDLTSIAYIGLMKARNSFDHSRGFKFTTYAHFVIFNELADAQDKNLNELKRYQKINFEDFISQYTSSQVSPTTVYRPLEIMNLVSKGLSQLECEILIRRFGLGSQIEETLNETADNTNQSHEKVRRTEQNALRALAKLIAA